MRDLILLVDDNAITCELVTYILKSAGFDTRTAGDATQALEVLQSIRPRLILMDVQLPGMSGLELTRQLKADPATRDLVIVAVTAYADKRDEQKARAAGCDGYIVKPIERKKFVEQVRGYL